MRGKEGPSPVANSESSEDGGVVITISSQEGIVDPEATETSDAPPNLEVEQSDAREAEESTEHEVQNEGNTVDGERPNDSNQAAEDINNLESSTNQPVAQNRTDAQDKGKLEPVKIDLERCVDCGKWVAFILEDGVEVADLWCQQCWKDKAVEQEVRLKHLEESFQRQSDNCMDCLEKYARIEELEENIKNLRAEGMPQSCVPTSNPDQGLNQDKFKKRLKREQNKRLSKTEKDFIDTVDKYDQGPTSNLASMNGSQGKDKRKPATNNKKVLEYVRNKETPQNISSPIGSNKAQGHGEREKLIVIGSSMPRGVEKHIKMKEKGSYMRSISGAGIKQIMNEAVDAAGKAVGKTKIFICGGGNSLKFLGKDRTVRSVVEGLQSINEKNASVESVVMAICPRPREPPIFDQIRDETNLMLEEEVNKLAEDGYKVKFVHVDHRLRYDVMFKRDGVHLNHDGLYELARLMLGEVEKRRRQVWRGGSPPLPGMQPLGPAPQQ